MISVPVLIGRLIIGLPTILVVKFCSKALAKWLLPLLCNAMGIPVRSSCYVAGLNNPKVKESQPGSVNRMMAFSAELCFDVDTGIRFLQYAGLGWSVVDLVPSLFAHLGL